MNTPSKGKVAKLFTAATFKPSKISSRLVLMGGGHSHVQFLKGWRMRPLAGVEMVLVSPDSMTPYSGLLPARLAGWVSDADMHFNLPNLCAQSGVTFIADQVSGFDLPRQQIILRDSPPLVFDVASLNVGITPQLPIGAESHAHVTAVKPIGELLAKWDSLWTRIRLQTCPRLVVIGAGAAGFEIAMICHLLLRRRPIVGSSIVLLQSEGDILLGHADSARRQAVRLLERAGVTIKLNCEVREVSDQKLLCTSGETVAFSEAIVTTGARAPTWLAQSGLPVNEHGFVCVDSSLRVQNHKNIFAAGDCIHFTARPLPKSGVYAVRAGPILSENLRRTLRGKKKLRHYQPQRGTLALLTSGEERALASYRRLSLESKWLWQWKHRIDRRFMRKFGVDANAARPMDIGINENTCGGCGGKLAAQEVEWLVTELRQKFPSSLPSQVEDVGQVGEVVTSIDGFRTFTSDLYFFGQVATWHALNDFFASGVSPLGLNAYAGLPEAKAHIRRNHLLHLMSGVLQALGQMSTPVPLLNAHSAEANEPTLVVAPVGKCEPSSLWSKSGLRMGDKLILSKPLGTGCLLQAAMAGALGAEARRDLQHSLLQHHASLLAGLHEFSLKACTDISGFGLAGHLWEMVRASQVRVSLQVAQIPVLAEFHAMNRRGFRSYLARQNEAAFADHFSPIKSHSAELWDPQTHGPLLFGVPEVSAVDFMLRLQYEGFAQARVIGQVVGVNSAGIELG